MPVFENQVVIVTGASEGIGRALCLALPYLKASKGRIVAVSSVAGLNGVPTRTAYSASKHAMFGFFDSLRIELMGTGVTVTMIAPDYVLSEIHRTSPMQESKIMTAEHCAAQIVDAMEKRERLRITSLRGRVGRWVKLLPPGAVDRIARKAIRDAK